MKQKSNVLMGILIAILLSVSFTSCIDNASEQKEDATVALDPHSAVNIDIKVTHGDTFDLMTTIKTIHDEKGGIVKVLTSIDTLPKLSLVRDTLDTHRTFEDDNGDAQEIDTVITHAKDYQLYIAVKK